MSKTAQDRNKASELDEVTTEAHSQSARNSEPPEDLDRRTGNGRSTEGTEYMESTPGTELAPAAGAAVIDVEIEPAAAAPDSPEPEAHAAGGGDALDVDQAERFAASFRPSWAPDHPVAASEPAPVLVSGPARVVRLGTRSDLSTPKIRKQRGAAYAILSASLLGVAGLFYLAIASSSTKPGPAELAHRAQPSETSTHAARQPSAAPAAPPPAAEPEPAATPEPAQPEQLAAAEPATSEPAAVAPPVPEPAQAEAPAAEPKPEPEVAAAPPPAAEPAPAPAVVAAAPKPAPAPPAAAPAAKPAAALAVAAAPPLAAAQKPAEAPVPKMLLSLAAFPPNTQLRIDGGTVPNPFRMRLPHATKHRIEARAPGFAPETHVLRMDADVQLMISLKRDATRDITIKADPYKDARHSAANGPAPTRQRGAGFVSENPY